MPKVAEPEHMFGRWLRAERQARGWSVDDLTARMQAAGLDISRSKVGELELYDSPGSLTVARLQALAIALDLPAATVLEAAGFDTRAPTRLGQLSLEEAGVITDLRAMDKEAQRHWIVSMRALRAYARTQP